MSIGIPRDMLESLIDMAVQSVNWGSGFMDSEDVDTLRAAAKLLDIPPRDVTPEEFRLHYLDPLSDRELETLRNYRSWRAEYVTQGRDSAYYSRRIGEFEKRMAANGQAEGE